VWKKNKKKKNLNIKVRGGPARDVKKKGPGFFAYRGGGGGAFAVSLTVSGILFF